MLGQLCFRENTGNELGLCDDTYTLVVSLESLRLQRSCGQIAVADYVKDLQALGTRGGTQVVSALFEHLDDDSDDSEATRTMVVEAVRQMLQRGDQLGINVQRP